MKKFLLMLSVAMLPLSCWSKVFGFDEIVIGCYEPGFDSEQMFSKTDPLDYHLTLVYDMAGYLSDVTFFEDHMYVGFNKKEGVVVYTLNGSKNASNYEVYFSTRDYDIDPDTDMRRDAYRVYFFLRKNGKIEKCVFVTPSQYERMSPLREESTSYKTYNLRGEEVDENTRGEVVIQNNKKKINY